MSAKSATREPQSLIDLVEPWIPRDLIDILITHAAGVGLVMIVAGAFMKQTHVPARTVSLGQQYDPAHPDRSIYSPDTLTQTIPPSAGLDLLVWRVTLPVSVRDAESFWNWLKGVGVPAVAGAASALSNPFAGLVGQLVSALMPSFDTASVSGAPFVVEIYLSDVLILAGAGMAGGSAAMQLLPKL